MKVQTNYNEKEKVISIRLKDEDENIDISFFATEFTISFTMYQNTVNSNTETLQSEKFQHIDNIAQVIYNTVENRHLEKIREVLDALAAREWSEELSWEQK